MTVIKVCGVVLAALMFVIVMKRTRPEFSALVSVASGVLIIGMAVAMTVPAMEYLRDISSQSGFSEYTEVVFKAVGIGVVTEMSAAMCSDAGESSLASQIGFFGRAEILLLSLPLLKNVVDMASQIVK